MNRRDLLKLALSSAVVSSCSLWRKKRVGVALGGGGARGLAHVLMLEVLDELAITPHMIAGTSIGSVVGGLYASGISARDIRNLIDRLTIAKDESLLASLFNKDVWRWFDIIDVELGSGGLLDTLAVAQFLKEHMRVSSFEQLKIPLRVVAANFWSREQKVFVSGDLLPAIQSSIAIPGLFSPVRYKGQVYIDGGMVNPVPYDLLFDECDVVVAIDVLGNRTPESPDNGPGYFETTFNTFQIMQAAIVREKMKYRSPDIYIKPDLENIRVLDFNRAKEIYAQSASARDELKSALRWRNL